MVVTQKPLLAEKTSRGFFSYRFFTSLDLSLPQLLNLMGNFGNIGGITFYFFEEYTHFGRFATHVVV